MKQTKAEIQDAKDWLAKGHSPIEVRDRFYKVRDYKGRRDFIGQPGTNHELEAFSAGVFGQMLGAIKVFIVDGPDARFEFPNGDVITAEIVYADREGRKMSEEDFPEPVAPHSDYLSSNMAQNALEVACAKKIGKEYASADIALIIYLNGFWVLEEQHRKILIAGTKEAGAKFGAVYVHDSYGITRAWKCHRPAYRRWWFEVPRRKRNKTEESKIFSDVFK